MQTLQQTAAFRVTMVCESVSMTGIHLKQIFGSAYCGRTYKAFGKFFFFFFLNTITIINCLTKKPI